MTLPKQIQEKIAAMPETSHGANRVTLILKDGRRISDVVVAWSDEVVKVGGREVKKTEDLGFVFGDIVDVTL